MSVKKLQIKKRVVCKCNVAAQPMSSGNNRENQSTQDTTITFPTTGVILSLSV